MVGPDPGPNQSDELPQVFGGMQEPFCVTRKLDRRNRAAETSTNALIRNAWDASFTSGGLSGSN